MAQNQNLIVSQATNNALMIRTIALILEMLLVAAAIVFAILWTRTPTGTYEPPLALCTALAVGLEVVRRYLRSSRLRFFLSVGATYTKEQEDFVRAFERLLSETNVQRLVVGRDSPPSRQPILEVKDLMKRADAVVVLAFTRYVIASGVEKPDANLPGQKQRAMVNERHPTVWNQIEASIAFGLGKPLFVLLEDGLKQEAMLKDRFEFMARSTSLDPNYFESQAFKSVFANFIKIVRRRSWFRL
jgi:hypothetical protein